jgi:hypothetical protein
MLTSTELIELRKTLLWMVSENKITNDEALDLLAKVGFTQVDEYICQIQKTHVNH